MAISMFSSMMDRVRGWNRLRKSRRQQRRPARMTAHGFLFQGSRAMLSGEFEPQETALIQKLLGNVDRFVNVGANVGYYCCFAQQRGLPTVAIEPIPSNVAGLSKNMRANGWGERITVLPVAVGETSGFVDVYGEGTGASAVPGWANNPLSHKQTVPLVRLDDVIPLPRSGDRTLVLMDVEGFELFALRGATKLLSGPDKPVWVIEIATDVHQPKGITFNPHFTDVFRLMESLGYAAFEFEPSFRPLPIAEVERIVSEPTTYTFHGNYLFLDRACELSDLLAERTSQGSSRAA